MRRTVIAVFVVMLAAVPAGPVLAQSAQTQDPIISSARQFSQQGDHDTALAMLRSGLAKRPADVALQTALFDVLVLKQRELLRVLNEVNREIATLQPSVRTTAVAGVFPPASLGCGESAATPRPSAPVRVGGSIMQPQRTNWVPPVYPPVAQEAKVEGIVILEIMVDCVGNVVNPKVLRGQPLLNDAALESVRQWHYTPTLLNGVPVPVIMTVTVTFRVQ